MLMTMTMLMLLLGDVAVSLYDSEGNDVVIETVDNGNSTFGVSFVPQSVGTLTAKIFFDDVEIPDSPYEIHVEPHLPVERITVRRPDTTGTLSIGASCKRPLLSDSVSVAVSICLSAALLEPTENVPATLQSLQRCEPRRLPASRCVFVCLSVRLSLCVYVWLSVC